MNRRLIYYSAPWCAPCKRMTPLVDRLEGIEVERIDVSTYAGPTRGAVTGVPTFVLFEGDEEIARKVGPFRSFAELEKWTKK